MFRSPQAVAAANRAAKPHLNKSVTIDGEEFSFWSMAPNRGVWLTNGKRFVWQAENGHETREGYLGADVLRRRSVDYVIETPEVYRSTLCVDNSMTAQANPSGTRMFPVVH